MSDIGARFVACKGWRWMPGMIANGRNYGGSKRSGVVTEIVSGRPNVVTSAGDDVILIGAEPDTSAPSTLGCILALVREAWGEPLIYVRPASFGWVAGAPLARDLSEGRTEAEALLAALEAAP